MGNNRIVANQNSSVVQSTQYYPFGMAFADGVDPDSQPYKFGGKELDSDRGLNWYDQGTRPYMADLLRTPTPDPHAENYYSFSPYSMFENNPILMIDPTGMDNYRYDDKTGAFHLMETTKDEFDQVLGYHYDKKAGEWQQNTKWYQTKTRIDNVEKGILSDGINFKENNNVISVGGEGQATVDGVEAFAVNLSDMVGKEIGGAYFSKDGAGSTTHISIGGYKGNTHTEANSNGHATFLRLNPKSTFENSLTGFFHTHPSGGNINDTDRTRSSEQDRKSRDKALKPMPLMRFYILTHPINYGDKFPYKIDYTNE